MTMNAQQDCSRPTLYALNVGRGDAFFLEIPADDHPFVVLIDGGDRFIDEKIEPFRFVRHKGWSHIDLMILTHLHPDHIVGLLDVAKHVPVREAVLPYPRIPLPSGEMRNAKAVQTARLFRAYGRLWELLCEQQTRVSLRPPFGEKNVWQFGETRLRHLDPTEKSDLAAYATVELLGSAPAEQQDRLCATFDAQSNGDSSVWLLEQADGTHLFLFGGDALLANWERITKRESLRPRGFKVPHHGMKDAWNEHLLKSLSPDWVMITNDAKEYEIFRDEWNQLAQCSGCRLIVTGSQPNTHYWTSQLPSLPERVELA